MTHEQRRLFELFGRLDAVKQSSLLDYAEFLAARAAHGVAPRPETAPRPDVETVVQAIKRLNRTYPMAQRHRLMPAVETLLAEHLMNNRPAPQVIDELEALFAAQYRLAEGD